MYRIMTAKGDRTATSLIEVQRLYNRSEIAIDDVLERDNEKRRLMGDALGESLLGSGCRTRIRRAPIPPPPPISWSFVLLIGCLTGGWALGLIGVIQGVWSRRFSSRLMPVIWPLCGLIVPPAHLVWAVSLLFRHHPEILNGLLHLVIGFCVAEIISICFTSLGSLSIRKTLLHRFGQQGFRMNLVLTALLPATFVAYKAEELKRLHE